MNTENERLDDLFKKKLEDPVDEIRFEEGDWDSLEKMLDNPRKRRGIVYLLPILSGVAAMLLLFLGWWAFRPKTETHPAKNQVQLVVRHKAVDSVKVHSDIQQPLTPVQKTSSTMAYANKTIKNGNYKSITEASNGHLKAHNNVFEKANNINNTNSRTDDELVAVNPVSVTNRDGILGEPVNANIVPRFNGSTAGHPPVIRNAGTKRATLAYRPRFALSVVAAPDVNGDGTFQQGKVGTNIGLLFSAGVSKKFTISTGALYSVKPYMTDFQNYPTASKWAVDPLTVTADCRMLDIPLNIGYQVYHKQQNRISIGTGLSSYLMLHESYKFNYEYAGESGPANYTVPNAGKYFFGVVNLNATYERQINSKVGISVQPYLKLPLTNIGYSQVRLQTTGVAVGLTWNLNSLIKP